MAPERRATQAPPPALLHCRHPLQSRHRQRPGRLHDGAGFVEDIFDRRAYFVIIHPHDRVDVFLAEGEWVFPHLAHGHTVGEYPDLRQDNPLSGRQGLIHGIGFERLDADDTDLGDDGFQIGRHPGNETPWSSPDKARWGPRFSVSGGRV